MCKESWCQIRAGDVTVAGLSKTKKQGEEVSKGWCLKKGGAVAILQTMFMLLRSYDYHKKISINIYKRSD